MVKASSGKVIFEQCVQSKWLNNKDEKLFPKYSQ
jgi:hypothetical protein